MKIIIDTYSPVVTPNVQATYTRGGPTYTRTTKHAAGLGDPHVDTPCVSIFYTASPTVRCSVRVLLLEGRYLADYLCLARLFT